MTWKKFEYFCNAVHYCIWIGFKKNYKYTRRCGDKLFSPLKYLFTKNFREKYYENKRKYLPQWDNLYLNGKDGYLIALAHRWMGNFYSCYPMFISFALFGLGERLYGNVSSLVMLILIFCPAGVCYIPLYKALYANDRYLKYFRKFEKEDERWHKKWSRITTLFCVGAALFFIGGIFAMILLGPH